MGISTQTIKMLWGRAAARCSMPSCRIELILDETETDDPALIGEMAHIVAEKEDGPRGKSPLTAAQRDLYDNLVLLCRNHHREIGTQVSEWSVDRLKQLRVDHEAWVRQSFPGYDPQRQRDEERLALYVDQWAKLVHLREWKSWTSSVFAHGQPALENDIRADLNEVPSWTLKRVWPELFPPLRRSFQNFSLVLRDFLNEFDRHAKKPHAHASFMQTEKFYSTGHWDELQYNRLARLFDHHVDLVQDLALELTRAANLVCDEIRAHLLPSFYLEEGRLSVLSGPHADVGWREMVVQYSRSERAAAPFPYPGPDRFLDERGDRDMAYGKGAP